MSVAAVVGSGWHRCGEAPAKQGTTYLEAVAVRLQMVPLHRRACARQQVCDGDDAVVVVRAEGVHCGAPRLDQGVGLHDILQMDRGLQVQGLPSIVARQRALHGLVQAQGRELPGPEGRGEGLMHAHGLREPRQKMGVEAVPEGLVAHRGRERVEEGGGDRDLPAVAHALDARGGVDDRPVVVVPLADLAAVGRGRG